jgi:hypothetical protein
MTGKRFCRALVACVLDCGSPLPLSHCIRRPGFLSLGHSVILSKTLGLYVLAPLRQESVSIGVHPLATLATFHVVPRGGKKKVEIAKRTQFSLQVPFTQKETKKKIKTL